MRPVSRRGVATIAAVSAAVAAVLVGAWARPKKDEVAVFVVTPSPFIRRVTAEGNLKAVKSTPLAAPTDAPGPLKIAWIAVDGLPLKKDDLVARFDPTDFAKMLQAGQEDRATAGNKIVKSTKDASTTKTNLKRDAKQAGEELATAKHFSARDAEIFSRYQQVESELDEELASERMEYANHVLGVREQLSAADRDLLGIENRKADLKIRNAEQGLHALEVRAPYDGILVLQRDWRGEVPRVGATVWAGSPVGEIPELSTMKAELFVLEADAAGLAAGQKATVTLESQPGVTYIGKITQTDKLARPRMRGVPVQYFGVTVSLDKTVVAVMKPGTRVHAVIEIENRADAISVPRQALFEKDGKKLVYRRTGGKFVPAEVTIGSSSAGRVVITKGVAKGDVLAMSDPTADAKSGDRKDS
jgi:HlyD family secretion protein